MAFTIQLIIAADYDLMARNREVKFDYDMKQQSKFFSFFIHVLNVSMKEKKCSLQECSTTDVETKEILRRTSKKDVFQRKSNQHRSFI